MLPTRPPAIKSKSARYLTLRLRRIDWPMLLIVGTTKLEEARSGPQTSSAPSANTKQIASVSHNTTPTSLRFPIAQWRSAPTIAAR